MIDGAKIRNLREATGTTMKELGDKAGVSEVMISYVERNLRSLNAETLKHIADSLDVKVDELYKQ